MGPVYKEYSLETKWHAAVDEHTEIAMNPPAPEQRVQLAESGPELVARYPVELNRASEIDEKITRALMKAIHADEKLGAAVAGTPKIRAAGKA
jgi:hypothetical protein